MSSFHKQYVSGQRDSVWHQLRELGKEVRTPRYYEDARAVAREAMTRARQNVATIIDRLRKQSYVFGETLEGETGPPSPHAAPDDDSLVFADWLDERFGPIPITVRAWIEIVGDVSLIGLWSEDCDPDPLVIEFEGTCRGPDVRSDSRRRFEEDYEFWQERCERGYEEGRFCLAVAPDAILKEGGSGGLPYGFLVPDASADGMFRFEDCNLITFIEYLRLAFSWGGFPGFRYSSNATLRNRIKQELARGLLPL